MNREKVEYTVELKGRRGIEITLYAKDGKRLSIPIKMSNFQIISDPYDRKARLLLKEDGEYANYLDDKRKNGFKLSEVEITDIDDYGCCLKLIIVDNDGNQYPEDFHDEDFVFLANIVNVPIFVHDKVWAKCEQYLIKNYIKRVVKYYDKLFDSGDELLNEINFFDTQTIEVKP